LTFWVTLILIIGLLLARACYLAAISQALSYGKLVQVAFDFYRHDILKQMHIPVPDNLRDERFLWTALNSVVDEYSMPWQTTIIESLPSLNSPFYYDTHEAQDVTITIKGLPKMNIKHEETK
jgi:hypothetical protein